MYKCCTSLLASLRQRWQELHIVSVVAMHVVWRTLYREYRIEKRKY